MWFKSRQRNHNIWFIEVIKWIMCSNVSCILFFVMMFLKKYPWFYYSIMWGLFQKGRNQLIFWITYDLYRWGICKLYDLVEPFSSVWKGEENENFKQRSKKGLVIFQSSSSSSPSKPYAFYLRPVLWVLDSYQPHLKPWPFLTPKSNMYMRNREHIYSKRTLLAFFL